MTFWENYYERKIDGDNPLTDTASSFAIFAARYVHAGATLIDLGAGNGRDATFFLDKGLQVTACDQANSLKNEKIPFLCQSMDSLPETAYKYAYSRFSLHSITAEQQQKVFQWARRNCDWFFIETRSVHDPRYGKGTAVAENAFEDTHYRRFTTLDDLINEARGVGFEIEHAGVDFKSSWFGDDKAVVNRLILRASSCSDPEEPTLRNS
jgi:hypothetical protein